MSYDQASKQIDRQTNREYTEISSELGFFVLLTETKKKHSVLVYDCKFKMAP